MPYLAPPTLTRAEQESLLRASSVHCKDHLILYLALGTALRLAEIVGLDVGARPSDRSELVLVEVSSAHSIALLGHQALTQGHDRCKQTKWPPNIHQGGLQKSATSRQIQGGGGT